MNEVADTSQFFYNTPLLSDFWQTFSGLSTFRIWPENILFGLIRYSVIVKLEEFYRVSQGYLDIFEWVHMWILYICSIVGQFFVFSCSHTFHKKLCFTLKNCKTKGLFTTSNMGLLSFMTTPSKGPTVGHGKMLLEKSRL